MADENTSTIELQRIPIITSSKKSLPQQEEPKPAKMTLFSSQVISTLILSSTMTHAGVTLAFPNLLKTEFDKDLVATYASISALATPLGTFLTGFFNDRIGRKKTMILLKLLSIFTWLVATLLRNPFFFYSSSVLSGLTRGVLSLVYMTLILQLSAAESARKLKYFNLGSMAVSWYISALVVVYTGWFCSQQRAFLSAAAKSASCKPGSITLTATCPAYIAEISQGDYRQLFLSLLTLFFMIGVFFVTMINELLKWQGAALCFIVFFALLLALIVFFVPESPHWLAILKLDTRQAKVVLKKLIPDEKTFNKEWKLIMKKQESISTAPSLLNKLAMIRKPRVYKPCIILLILIFFQQFCAIYPMSSLTVYVIPKVGNKVGQNHTAEIFFVIGILRLITTFLATLCLAKINQKQLLMISSAGMLVSALPVFCLKLISTNSTDTSQTTDWIFLILLTIYICASSVGILGVPWTIISELLPTEVRGLLGPFLVTVGYVTMSGTIKVFLSILEIVGVASMFLYLSILSLTGLTFIYVYIPETKGKSLVEIEKFFAKPKNENAMPINPS